MKKCPNCNQTYSDESLNFCLADGTTLIKISDDPPPTVFMNQARVTSPVNMGAGAPFSSPGSADPVSPWQNQQMSPPAPGFMAAGAFQTQDKTLPTISLVLGILGLVFFCCYGGIYLGVPAIVTGYLAFNNTNKNPSQYGGRGMAITGMVLGTISLIGVIMLIIFGILGNI